MLRSTLVNDILWQNILKVVSGFEGNIKGRMGSPEYTLQTISQVSALRGVLRRDRILSRLPLEVRREWGGFPSTLPESAPGRKN